MIDLKALRQDPQRFRDGCRKKRIAVDIDGILELDARRRELVTRQEELRAEQKRLSKESGPRIGEITGRLRQAAGPKKAELEAELAELRGRPARLKDEIQGLEAELAAVAPRLDELLLRVPQPPDPDVPVGESSEDNVELERWSPENYDLSKSFQDNRGFSPRSHIELGIDLGIVDFERGVKIAGSRSYVLSGLGMRLQQAVLRYAMDLIIEQHGFTPVYVPVLVREECMVGTGFFPEGREQTYHVEESQRGAGHDLFLTGTGEVGLMSLYKDEILDPALLPLQLATVSTCFRREAGAAGRDTAGLYRIHQFEKVEQVVICRADEAEIRRWLQQMLAIVRELLRNLGLPHRLLQCCTGDLGPKNADMIDVECWMPSRGELDGEGRPLGAFGETHSASRLYDFQCRRLNLRYRGEDGRPVFAHSLNNTVAASPRILIPLLEMHQDEQGGIAVPPPLQEYMGGVERIEKK